MKKLFISLASLLILAGNSHAGTISISPFVSNADVTIAHLESQRSTLQNVINGNIAGGVNILAGSLVSPDFATSVSIVKFRDESFNDWTLSGMLPATDASLTSNISAGISYVNGVRIETAAQAHTYTASKDTYVYMNAGGSFDFVEVANGATAPATPANDLLLAKAITSGTAITTVTDLRTLSISITANSSNFPADYRNEGLVIRDSTTAVHAEPGQISIGNTLYTITSDTTSLSTATAGNWIEGQVGNLNNLKFYVYGYNNSGTQWDLKYASADPVNSDTSGNTAGTLRYYTTGGTTYRALAYISADSTGLIQTKAFGNFLDTTIVNKVTFQTSAVATGATAIPLDDTFPLISEGNEYMNLTFRPTNSNNLLRIDVVYNGGTSAAGGTATVALFQNSVTNAIAATNSSYVAAANPTSMAFTHYMTAGTTSPIIFRVRAGQNTAVTTTFNGVGGARLYEGVATSSISVTETIA